MNSKSPSLPLPLIKICGLTRDADIDAVAHAGGNAVGINLVAGSPRCVTREQAGTLIRKCRQLGLFVIAVVRNLPKSQLVDVMNSMDLDGVQLHGDEELEVLPVCGDRVILKAVSWSGRDHELQLASAWKQGFHRSASEGAGNTEPRFAFLVDAYAPLTGGGTGKTARWDLIWPRPMELADTPLILAGGLRPDNVAQAISQTQCDGVDTASGVEDAPGVKSAKLIHEFVARAKAAFQSQASD